MPIPDYLRELRSFVGSRLLLVPSVTGLVYDESGRILLVRHSEGGVWVAPGGAVDPDESPQDAVVREIWEETGLLVEPITYCGTFGGPDFRVLYSNGDQCAYVMSVFECLRLRGHLQADQVETLDARFFEPEELTNLDLSHWAKKLLPELLQRRGQVWMPPVGWRPPPVRG